MYEGANGSDKSRVVSPAFADAELVSHLFILKCIFFISMPVKASFVFLFALNSSSVVIVRPGIKPYKNIT
jgi:hypothetical protein